MTINAAIKEIINSCSPTDEIVSCTQQDYYNSSNPQYEEVYEVIKENGKLIILTR